MSEILGVQLPEINLTGFLSSSWIYVFIVAAIGFVLIVGICILLFFMTYKRKIVLFENISGQGYQPVLKTRARIIKLGVGGEELLKTLFGGQFISAYGRKMGTNTYWYAKGTDGYWYNIILGDLDSKMAMLDIDPIDRDVRMFHVALDRLSHQTYDKQSWLEKHTVHLMLFVFLIVFLAGMWIMIGKMGEATAPLGQNQQMALKLTEAQSDIASKLNSILRAMGKIDVEEDEGSGLIPADNLTVGNET